MSHDPTLLARPEVARSATLAQDLLEHLRAHNLESLTVAGISIFSQDRAARLTFLEDRYQQLSEIANSPLSPSTKLAALTAILK